MVIEFLGRLPCQDHCKGQWRGQVGRHVMITQTNQVVMDQDNSVDMYDRVTAFDLSGVSTARDSVLADFKERRNPILIPSVPRRGRDQWGSSNGRP